MSSQTSSCKHHPPQDGRSFHNQHDAEEEGEEEDHHAGATEAGIVRGVSRSVAQRAAAARTAGKSMARFPAVQKFPHKMIPKARAPSAATRMPKGSLPRARSPHVKLPSVRAPKASSVPPRPRTAPRPTSVRRGVPVKRVSKVADRMSTGLDLWDSASSSTGTGQTKKSLKRKRKEWNQRLARIGTFVTSLIKNTVLGTVVFESYCWMVAHSEQLSGGILSLLGDSTKQEKQRTSHNNEQTANIYKDVFETTPVSFHYMAGGLAGSLQGISTNLWDIAAHSINVRKMDIPKGLTPVSRLMIQHGVGHSILFGSYESWKRLFLWQIEQHKNSTFGEHIRAEAPQKRFEYFFGVAAAGGLAGQMQHVSSHVIEQPPRFRLTLPALRSTLWAFPPSAIAFLAFEYGKDYVAELLDDDADA